MINCVRNVSSFIWPNGRLSFSNPPYHSRRPEITFPSVKEWNESQYGIIVNRVSEFISIFGDTSLFESLSVTASTVLLADNRLVWHDFLVRRTFQFNEKRTICEFFTQHPSILSMGLCEAVLVNAALNITFISVDSMSAMPQSVALKTM
jgi:hypothetical protein